MVVSYSWLWKLSVDKNEQSGFAQSCRVGAEHDGQAAA